MEILEPSDAARWVIPEGGDATFRSLLEMKRDLIIAEFERVCELADEVGGPLKANLRRFSRFSEQIQRKVMLHPAGVFWIRSSHRLALACRGTAVRHISEKRTLEKQLEQAAWHFRDFELGAAYLSQAAVETEIQLDKRGGLSLPGTGLVLEELGPPGELVPLTLLQDQNTPTFVSEGRRVPFRQTGGCGIIRLPRSVGLHEAIEINSRDRRFIAEWIPRTLCGSQPASAVAIAGLSAWEGYLNSALDVLAELNAPLAEEAAALLLCIVPIVSPLREHQLSCSADEFFGSCQVSARTPIGLAEEVAHEYRHNILNALISFDPILSEDENNGVLIYSPWKRVPRPRIGILHAIYSFQEVLALYASWLDAHPDDIKRLEQSAIQAARLEYAIPALRSHVQLTVFGCAFVDRITERVDELIALLERRKPDLFDRARANLKNERQSFP